MQPTLAGFLQFIRTTMGITVQQLPDNSPVIGMAFAVALAIVNPALRKVAIPQTDSTGAQLNSGGYTIYALAAYNLAADNLINYAPDQPGQCYFTEIREKLGVNAFVAGVIDSSSDQGTSESLVVQEAAKNFTLANLQQLKTSYGRQYLAFAQSYGPSSWGLT